MILRRGFFVPFFGLSFTRERKTLVKKKEERTFFSYKEKRHFDDECLQRQTQMHLMKKPPLGF